MVLDLEQKRIVVTGGARGIGEAIVKALAEEKAYPVLIDKNEEDAKKVQKECKEQFNVSVDFFICDLSDFLETKILLKIINSKYESIYGLVNNAGINDGINLQSDVQDFIGSLDKNLIHYFQMTSGLVDKIKKCHGSIVNISSKVAVTGQGGTSGYVAAKGAINALTREWAVDLAPFGVDVNAIIPAEVRTPQYNNWLKTKNGKRQLKNILKKINLNHRLTKPEEIAAFATFLLSKKNSHTTGQLIFVDGGYTHLDDSKIE